VGGAGADGARLRKKVNKVVQKKWWNILKGAFLLSNFRVSRLRECFLARKSRFFPSCIHAFTVYSLRGLQSCSYFHWFRTQLPLGEGRVSSGSLGKSGYSPNQSDTTLIAVPQQIPQIFLSLNLPDGIPSLNSMQLQREDIARLYHLSHAECMQAKASKTLKFFSTGGNHHGANDRKNSFSN
jgi:hypothetical protein